VPLVNPPVALLPLTQFLLGNTIGLIATGMMSIGVTSGHKNAENEFLMRQS
jgi:hypothetical protein